MIHIEKDSEIFGEANLRVATATGDYEDGALIEFYNIENPDVVAGSFQAQYIKYGNMVYTYNGHMELGNAILKIDPESTHTSASYVRMSRDLLAQMNGGSLEVSSLDQVINTQKKNIEDQIEETEASEEEAPVEDVEESAPQDTEEGTPETPAESQPETPVENESVSETESVLPAPVARIIRKTKKKKIA